jgi:organic radical activating enzyme
MTELENKKIIKVTPLDESLMSLTWMINNKCNNRCTYCVPELNTGIGDHYTWDNVKKFLDSLFEKYPKIHCSTTGGEPSLSEFFPELVKIFNFAGHSIGTTSNAYKSLEYWEDLSKYLYYICFSYHPEFPAKNFKEKAIAASLNTYVTIRVMMLPSHWDHCMEVYNSLKDIDTLLIEPVRILDWGSSDRKAHVYTQDQLDWFNTDEAIKPHEKIIYHLMNKSEPVELQSMFEFDDRSTAFGSKVNPLTFINAGMTNFEGYVCEIGLKSLFVRYDGSVQLGNCHVGGCIGNINDPENIKWPTGPSICTKNICHCATDVNVGKWIKDYQPLPAF